MATYYLWTMGCQMNQADSERLGAGLESLGHVRTPTLEQAEIVVLNSCVVRQSAENRVVSRLDSLKSLKGARPGILLCATGCLVDSQPEELKRRFPHVDLFLPPQSYRELWTRLGAREEPSLLPSRGPISAFLTISQGCHNCCSYCIVPYRRGPERSRPLTEVLCEARALVERGAKEITLLGQNVDSYGRDLPDKPDLADLLVQLHEIPGLRRLRFLTSHPRDLRAKIIGTIARLDKVFRHLSLPLQSGDDRVLKAMKRGYTANGYRKLVARLRDAMPGLALSTDVIVGFPGESEEAFLHTLGLLEEIRFDTVHVAAYSPRPGTLAARTMKDDVPSAVKKERLQRVEEIQERIAGEINRELVGKKVEVLVEGLHRGKWQGRTGTAKLTFFPAEGYYLGKLVEVEVEKASPWALQGKLTREVFHSAQDRT